MWQLCGITIDKPIVYEFVKYKDVDEADEPTDKVTFGTFHEWNGKYYICISDEIKESGLLYYIVAHETRHMVVEYLKDKKIINLDKYTEEIANRDDEAFNELFSGAVSLLRFKQGGEIDVD